MDFLNKNQKVYIGEEEKKAFLEKLKRDVEVMTGVFRSAFVVVVVVVCSIHHRKECLPFPYSLGPLYLIVEFDIRKTHGDWNE